MLKINRFCLLWLIAFCVALSLGYVIAANATAEDPVDWTESRQTRSQKSSVVVHEKLEDVVRFIYNRGDGRVNLRDDLMKFLDPDRVRKIKGFESPEKTLITIWAYEIRSRESVVAVDKLLKQGFHVRIVSDSGSSTAFKIPSEEVQKTWSQYQREYYLRAYDLDLDGKVTEADVLRYNSERERDITQAIWQRFEKLKVENKNLELIRSPYEVVPKEADALYIRLQHFKGYGVSLKTGESSWKTVEEIVTSANFTDSCLDLRVFPSAEAHAAYLGGLEYPTIGAGNIQFGAEFSGDIVDPLQGPRAQWMDAFVHGKHFDSVKLPTQQWPRAVIQDPRGYLTSVEAYYSEGTLSAKAGQKPVDPVYASLTEILSKPENTLKRFYDLDFVFTHKGIARHLRHHLAQDELEDFFVAVDGNFATAPYSALPDLLFADKKDNSQLVLPGKAIQQLKSIPPEQKWMDKIYSFEGDRSVRAGEGDKLHAKFSYLEYEDSQGVRHFVVRLGSGNSSSNAGKLNADAVYIIDSTDPEVRKLVMPFVEGVKAEPNLRRFSNAYVERRLLEMFNPTESLFPGHSIEELQGKNSFLTKFEELLNDSNCSQDCGKKLKDIIKELEEAGTINEYGQNFLQILKWYGDHADKRPFVWSDLELMLYSANPFSKLQPGFVSDLSRRWVKGDEAAAQSLVKIAQALSVFKRVAGEPTVRASNIARISNQCADTTRRLLLPVYEQLPISNEGVK